MFRNHGCSLVYVCPLLFQVLADWVGNTVCAARSFSWFQFSKSYVSIRALLSLLYFQYPLTSIDWTCKAVPWDSAAQNSSEIIFNNLYYIIGEKLAKLLRTSIGSIGRPLAQTFQENAFSCWRRSAMFYSFRNRRISIYLLPRQSLSRRAMKNNTSERGFTNFWKKCVWTSLEIRENPNCFFQTRYWKLSKIVLKKIVINIF